MKKFLLSSKNGYLKANLHTHTTISDGKLSPEEIKAHYKKNGYSVVAFTDHDVMVPHPELNDEGFLALNGYEVQLDKWNSEDYADTETCHICLIALTEDTDYPVASARTGYKVGNAINYVHYLKFRDDQPDFIREYNTECANQVFKDGRDHGYFVTYNHPTWSQENYPIYSKYEGMCAMEVFNTMEYRDYLTYNRHIYDDLLRQGKRIYCIYADDTHCHYPLGHPMNDACGGWVSINANELKYRTITKALEKGEFYSSNGPKIYDLYVEDGKIHVECSPVKRIIFSVGRRNNGARVETEEFLTSAEHPLNKDDQYIRITLVDEFGKCADTNAYFIEEII
jgi:hypothetical protein